MAFMRCLKIYLKISLLCMVTTLAACSLTKRTEKSYARNAAVIEDVQQQPFGDSLRYKVGLVLSGGGARGFAHAGAIKALHEFGIYPQIVSGTSAGAIAAVMYANGFSPESMVDVFRDIRFVRFPRFNWRQRELSDSSNTLNERYLVLNSTDLEKMLSKCLPHQRFDSLSIPIVVNATCLENGQNVYFTKGGVVKPVVASSSLPMAFSPVLINGLNYVDGGVMQNLSVTPIRKICKYIIAINLNPLEDYTVQNRMYEKHWQRVYKLAIRANTLYDKSLADVYIEPADLVHYSILDTKHGEEMFWIGYNATKEAIESYVKEHPDIVSPKRH